MPKTASSLKSSTDYTWSINVSEEVFLAFFEELKKALTSITSLEKTPITSTYRKSPQKTNGRPFGSKGSTVCFLGGKKQVQKNRSNVWIDSFERLDPIVRTILKRGSNTIQKPFYFPILFILSTWLFTTCRVEASEEKTEFNPCAS